MSDAIKELIKKYDLTADSKPCQICNAMNDIKVYEGKALVLKEPKFEYKTRKPKCDDSTLGGSVCLDKDKALIRLYFLQLAKDYF